MRAKQQRIWSAALGLMVLGVAGYFGPWVGHRAAGLVVTGLDLAEYVKFLTDGVPGGLFVRREIFYLPLIAGSLIASMGASRRFLPGWVRVGAALAAIVLAFCMLPPAWTPATLQQTEYRLQVVAIGVCLFVLAFALLAKPTGDRILLACVGIVSAIAASWAPAYFLRIVGSIAELYAEPICPAWGWWASVTAFGSLTVTLLVSAAASVRRRAKPGLTH